MPLTDAHLLEGLVPGLIALFLLIIVFGLRSARRSQATSLSDTTAAAILAETGASDGACETLLYGIWQTSLSEITMTVRDANDTEVATITHRVSGATITVGDQRHLVVTTSGWHESAMLIRADDKARAAPLATFERRGWIGGLARYTLADRRVISLRPSANFSWHRRALSIQCEGATIGQFFALGGSVRNRGRAVRLPQAIDLPIRLFILYRAAGARALNVVR